MQSASVLIVDDHPVYRDALQQFLSRKFVALNTTVHSAGSLKEGLSIVQSRPSRWVVLLDLIIPDSFSQFSGVQEFKKINDVVAIAAISGLENEAIEKQCLEEGCSIFISKSCNSTQIFERLCELMGLSLVEDEYSQLTDRQKEILVHMSLGQSNKMIAFSLNIS